MEASLTILYTAQLRGDLDRLPRLYSFLKRLRAQYPADHVCLVDLGEACAPSVWHCAITGGRSMLIALDGMNYDAATVTGFLTPESRVKLVEMGEVVRLQLLDADDTFMSAGTPIAMSPAPLTTIHGGRVQLAGVAAGQVGVAQISGEHLIHAAIHDLPAATLPDPTIAGMVEFIIAEARYTQKRRAADASKDQ